MKRNFIQINLIKFFRTILISMNKELDFITDFHLSTKREYLKRMIDDKINSMKVARKFEKDFWDGEKKIWIWRL